MRLNKNIKIFLNYILGPLLFIWLSWSIYKQVRTQPHLSLSWQYICQSLQSFQVWNLALVVGLMLVNWGIEAWKWQLAVYNVQPVSFGKAFRAVLSGVSFSVSTPNRIGEYMGRVLYMDDGNRLRAVSLTIVCSISQLIVTLVMGLIGLFVLMPRIRVAGIIPDTGVTLFVAVVLIAVFILTVFYFRLNWLLKWIRKLPGSHRYDYLVTAVGNVHATVLFQLLSLSAIRFCVFGVQYYLLFRLYGVDVGWWQGFWATSLTFLVLAVIPTIALLEVVQRSTVALKIFGLLSTNELGIALTAVTIWFINLIIPALAGSLLILGIKFFQRQK